MDMLTSEFCRCLDSAEHRVNQSKTLIDKPELQKEYLEKINKLRDDVQDFVSVKKSLVNKIPKIPE